MKKEFEKKLFRLSFLSGEFFFTFLSKEKKERSINLSSSILSNVSKYNFRPQKKNFVRFWVFFANDGPVAKKTLLQFDVGPNAEVLKLVAS